MHNATDAVDNAFNLVPVRPQLKYIEFVLFQCVAHVKQQWNSYTM